MLEVEIRNLLEVETKIPYPTQLQELNVILKTAGSNTRIRSSISLDRWGKYNTAVLSSHEKWLEVINLVSYENDTSRGTIGPNLLPGNYDVFVR